MIFKSIKPHTQEVIAEHEVLTATQLNLKLQLSSLAFKNWRATSFQERADKMKKLADILRIEKNKLGLLLPLKWVKFYRKRLKKSLNQQAIVISMQ